MGFTTHTEKSNLIPTHKLDILGFTIDSFDMTVSLKETKKKDLSNLISNTATKTFVKKKTLTSNRENSGSMTWVNVWCFMSLSYTG